MIIKFLLIFIINFLAEVLIYNLVTKRNKIINEHGMEKTRNRYSNW